MLHVCKSDYWKKLSLRWKQIIDAQTSSIVHIEDVISSIFISVKNTIVIFTQKLVAKHKKWIKLNKVRDRHINNFIGSLTKMLQKYVNFSHNQQVFDEKKWGGWRKSGIQSMTGRENKIRIILQSINVISTIHFDVNALLNDISLVAVPLRKGNC